LLFEWAARQAKGLEKSGDSAKFVVACLRSCLWVVECCLKYITKWCYVYIALDGDAFCPACQDTYRLLTGYPLTAASIGMLQMLLLAVQAFLIPLSCAIATFNLVSSGQSPGSWQSPTADWLTGAADWVRSTSDGLPPAVEEGSARVADFVEWVGGGDLESDGQVDALWPALAAFVLAFVVSRALASVYECVVDTMFVCAMRDKDEYGSQHTSESLRRCIEDGFAPSSPRDSARSGDPPTKPQ